VSDDLRQNRLDKRARLVARGVHPHPERFERTHTLAEAPALPDGTEGVALAGRLVAVRAFGRLTFAHLQDARGRMQIALERGGVDEATWEIFHDLLERGDFVGARGAIFTTKKGERTLRVASLVVLGKALLPLPEKWHGLKDTELRQRRRYLDLVMSDESRERFRTRSKVVSAVRRFLERHGFDEVETPVLQTLPSGAAARPFVTRHNALDLDVYLRIAPETWLKRLVAGGYDRVFEFARCFRNEGMDPSHLQDFTMLEYYCAYWNWEDNLRFTESLVRHVLAEVRGSLRLSWRGREIDFSGEWPRLDLGTLLRERTGVDVEAHPTADGLRAAIRAKGIAIERAEALGRGNLVDALYKATVRDELIQPCFLTGIPADTLPLARRNDGRSQIADCFQLLVNGWEIVKAYSELVDPIEQRRLFEEQEVARRGGDEEAMPLDEDFLLAMEYGMPPISGWGMGIERFCALLTGADSLRDVTLFPLLRPEAAATEAHGGGGGVAEEAAAFGMDRKAAMALFREHVRTEYLTRHCLASAAVCEAIAERFGRDRDTFWCMGLLHDLDFDRVKEPDLHTRETVRILERHGVRDPRILHAILAHNAEGLKDVARESWLDFALSCGESITGLVMASALVLPDRKLASLDPASVVKRMKKKDFAKQVSRENILQCERIGLSIEEFAALAVEAMRKIAHELGL